MTYPPLTVVADENIPYVEEAFAEFGPVRRLAASAQTPEAVRDADLLLVRSVTRVDDALLDGSRVKFVATATIGTDHVDTAALARRGVGFASAPGSNATSVAEWVVAALLEWTAPSPPATRPARPRGSLAGKTLGIIGAGAVGSRVLPRARALGMRVVWNDPPRARALEAGHETVDPDAPAFESLDTVLAESDFVTVHVPLNVAGEDRTLDFVDASFLAKMRPGAVLLNASRGKVVDEEALRAALDGGRLAGAALDVWRGEPSVSMATLRRTYCATPHIAGYSFDGKVAGTAMIYAAACRHFGRAATWTPEALLPPPPVPLLDVDAMADEPGGDGSRESRIRTVVRKVYAIREDDARLRATTEWPTEEASRHFTHLRKTYPMRREFRFTRVATRDAALARALSELGFPPA